MSTRRRQQLHDAGSPGSQQAARNGPGHYTRRRPGGLPLDRGALIPGGAIAPTMREASDRGYERLLVEEATGSYFPAFKQQAIEMIVAQGGIVGSSLKDLPGPA